MSRPRRLYYDKKKDKYYYLNSTGKKIFVKVPEGMTQKQIQTVNIKNIITGTAKRLQPKKKRVKVNYNRKISKEMEKVQTKDSLLPLYRFVPEKKFLDLSTSQKSDSSLKDVLDILLKQSKEVSLPKPVLVEPQPQPQPQPPAVNPASIPLPQDDDELTLDERIGRLPFSIIGKKPKYNNKDLTQIANELGLSDYKKKRTLEESKKFLLEVFSRNTGSLTSSGESDFEGLGKTKNENDGGLYNDELEYIMKNRVKHFVPVVAQDKINQLLPFVQPERKYFCSIINTDPSTSTGRHWRAIFIDNRDDFPSAEYFDSLCETSQPEPSLLEVMKKIAIKLNPEKMFKFKFNLLQRQNFSSSSCGYHCMQFLEDRINGHDFETATGWKSYQERKQKGRGGIPDYIDGEKNLEPYKKMIEKKFKYYL